jgi:hypothetical protein
MEREMKKKLMLLAVVLKYKKKGQGIQHASATSSSNTIMEGNRVSDKSPCPIHPHSKHTWGECNANRYKSKASGSNNHLQSHNKASAGPSAHVAQLSETASASDEDIHYIPSKIGLSPSSYFPYYLNITNAYSHMCFMIGMQTMKTSSVMEALIYYAQYYKPHLDYTLADVKEFHADVYCNNLRMDLTNGSDHQSHTYDRICEYTDSRVLTACKVQQHSHVCLSHFTAMFSSIHRLIWRPLMGLYTALEKRL